MAKLLEKSGSSVSNARQRLSWLRRLDCDSLSEQGGSFKDRDGKVRNTASDRETWYAEMSKAFLDAKQFDECITLCKEALERLPQFHYDNDIWFNRRIADATAAKGCYQESLDLYEKLVQRKREGYMYDAMARLAYKLDRADDALRFSAEAALATGPLHFKADTFLLIAKILRDDGKPELAMQHAQLAASVRSEQGWPAKGWRRQYFREFDVVLENGPPAKGLVHSLQKHWRTWRVEDPPRHEGEVEKVHHEKPFGFIKAGGTSESIYFRTRSFKGPKGLLVAGTRVSYSLRESYDKKKSKMSTEAVEVTPLD